MFRKCNSTPDYKIEKNENEKPKNHCDKIRFLFKKHDAIHLLETRNIK